MDGQDGTLDTDEAGTTSADATEATESGRSWIPSRLVAGAVVALFVQFLVMIVLLTRPLGLPLRQVVLTYLGLSFVATILIGYDAYKTDRDSSVDWSPNPFLWALPMFLPVALLPVPQIGQFTLGAPLGIGLAYAVRRIETQRAGLEYVWQWLAVGAAIFSGAGFGVLLLRSGSQALQTDLTVVLVVSSALYAFTTPAAYYDTRYVHGRLKDDDRNWLFSGYHWVLAMSIPSPLRSIVAMAYALRRWMLLSPDPVFGVDLGSGDEDEDSS